MTAPYYQDDLVTLYHGDCFQQTDWVRSDVLVTDPPYGVSWKSGGMHRTRTDAARHTTVAGDDNPDARDKVLALWGDRPALMFGSWRVPRPEGTKNRLIWYKAATIVGMRTAPWFSADEEIYQLGSGFTGKPEQNVITTYERRDSAASEVRKIGHPTPKPVGLMERLIAHCPPGVIGDPFAGAGATLIAARNLGRKAIGIELEERYCEISARRLSQQAFDFGAEDTELSAVLDG
jgi:site-specific DNA-methyltransferase (adenine-specific)